MVGVLTHSSDEPGHQRTCRVCGCTNANACLGGCWWIAADLCSACAEPDPDGLDLTPHQLLLSASAYAGEGVQKLTAMAGGHDARHERGIRLAVDALLMAVLEAFEALGDLPEDQVLAEAITAHREAERGLF